MRAVYGRIVGGTYCGTSKRCGGSKDLTRNAEAACNYKNSCKFVGTNNYQGDPCKVNKYTAIQYNCIKSKSNFSFNFSVIKVRPDHHLQCYLDCTDMSNLITINELCSLGISRDVQA